MARDDQGFPPEAGDDGAFGEGEEFYPQEEGDPSRDLEWVPEDEDTGPLLDNGFDDEAASALPLKEDARATNASHQSVRAQAAADDPAYVAKLATIASIEEQSKAASNSSTPLRIIVSITLIALALGVGAGAFNYLKSLAKDPEKVDPEALGQAARVFNVEMVDHHEEIGAYATVTTPLRSTTTARVAGEVIWVHPSLQEGAVLSDGDPAEGEPMPRGKLMPLMELDPAPYQLALDLANAQKTEAERQRDEAISAQDQIDVELSALPTRRANINSQLELAREAQSVAEEGAGVALESVRASESTLESIKQSLLAAKDTLELGKKQLQRLLDLQETGDATEAELDNQRVVVSNQEAAVVAATTQVRSGEAQLIEARNRAVSSKSAVVQAKTSVQTLLNQLDEIDESEKQLQARKISAQKAVARAESSIERVSQAIRSAELNLSYTKIYAPFPSARVRTMHARLGDYVAPGSPLFLSAGGSYLEIEVRVPADKRFGVTIGSPLKVLSRPDGEALLQNEVKVSRLSPIVDPNSRTRTAYVMVWEADMRADRLLQPGEMVYVELEGKLHHEVFRLPRSAEVESGFFVARPANEEQAKRGITHIARRVGDGALEVIARSGDYVLVRNTHAADTGSGFEMRSLQPGDQLIVSNLDVMVEGLAIRPVQEGENLANDAAQK